MVIDPALNGDELPTDDREDDLSALLQELSAEENEPPAAESETQPELALVLEPEEASQAEAEQLELTEAPAEEFDAAPSEPAVDEAGAAAEQPSPGPVAPAPVGETDVVAAGFVAEGRRVSVLPFAIYDLLWLAFAGVLVWQLAQLPQSMATYESAVYPLTVYAGLTLTVAGPLLLLGVWIVARQKTHERSGLLTSALLMGSAATMFGVTVWWLALLAVDYVRLGSLF